MKNNKKYILALDQGTTSSRSVLINKNGSITNSAQEGFKQYFPKSGWVEHNPEEIWTSQLNTINALLKKSKISASEIAAIGITNQRESVVIWERSSGRPIYNAIVWQDRRTAGFCDFLKSNGYQEKISKKTGLIIDPYFSASKIKWILDQVDSSRERARNGELCFGTIDTWLIWKLTNGKYHLTDVTNASRTMIFDIHHLKWDDDLLELFDIPKPMLPEIKGCSEVYAETDISEFETPVRISGIAGDQQAALFGQMCISKGMAKNTYGTGCFLLMNIGVKPVLSQHQLITTIAYQINGEVNYALEGSIFVGGAAVEWLRDGLGIIDNAPDIQNLAETTEGNGDIYFVPALTGIGAPYWNPHARGAIFGISRGTTKAHIARATLEGIAFQVYDVIKAMEEDAGHNCKELRVDGGAAANNLLMQFQADILDAKVRRPKELETTALGAAFLAGLAVGFWKNLDDLKTILDTESTVFRSQMSLKESLHRVDCWHRAVKVCQQW